MTTCLPQSRLWVCLAACLVLAGCNQATNNSAQIQALNDKIRDLEQREQALQLQSERDKLAAERAALDAERKSLEAQQQAFAAAGAQVSPTVSVEPSSSPDSRPRGPSPAANGDRDDDANLARAEPEPARDSYNVFYEHLHEGGRWFNDDTYGYVWQPDVAAADPNWRPYTDGHWAYTDRGWTWVSNETFGWACYHYGRWARLRDHGWIWTPGSQWAPAWVSWRESDADDCVGWAPLPPECEPQPTMHVEGWVDRYYDIGPAAYAFVKIADLVRPSYRQVTLPPQENVTLIERTKNVTNIYYNNQVVNNFGPQYERIVQRVGQPITKYQIDYTVPSQPNAAFQTVPSGNRLQVVAPAPRLQPRATVQPVVVQTIQNTQVEHGWQNVDPNRAQQLRQRLAQAEPQVPKDLPPKPTPPPKPLIVARQSPAPASGTSSGAPPAAPAPSLAAERARLEAERARLEQQRQALQQNRPGTAPGNPLPPPPATAPANPGAVTRATPANPPAATGRTSPSPQTTNVSAAPTSPPAAPQQSEAQRQAQLKAQQDAAQKQAEQQRQQQAQQQQQQAEAQRQAQVKAQQDAAQRQAEQQRQQQAQEAARQQQLKAQEAKALAEKRAKEPTPTPGQSQSR